MGAVVIFEYMINLRNQNAFKDVINVLILIIIKLPALKCFIMFFILTQSEPLFHRHLQNVLSSIFINLPGGFGSAKKRCVKDH